MGEQTLLISETPNGGVHEGHEDKLSVLTTAIFLVGGMAGTGVLALPAAMSDTGMVGFILIAAAALVSAYTGSVLGKCWFIVQSRFEEYRDCPRYPYPAIGMVTYGKVARILVSFCINATMFGSTVVFLLLAADNIDELTLRFNWGVSYCIWVCIIAVVVAPMAWFGTPKDFWPVAVTAALVTIVACFLIVTNSALDVGTVAEPSYKAIDLTGFLTAVGTIYFALGGHSAFPTIQVDMKEPKKFGQTCLIAYIVLVCLYEPVAISGYIVYGSAAEDNILNSLSDGVMKIMAEILVTIHLITAYIILINPVCQEVEDLLGISRRFGIGRVVTRTAISGLSLFVALSIPSFDNILSLIGGSTLTALSFIFPPIFYLKLCSMHGDWDKIDVPLYKTIVLICIIIIGLFIVVAATYSALIAIISGDFVAPCYL